MPIHHYTPDVYYNTLGSHPPALHVAPGDTIVTTTVDAKGYLLTGRVQPFALIGVGGMVAMGDGIGGNTEDESGFVARFGGGVDVYLNREVALSVSGNYVLGTGGVDDLSYASFGIGLLYRF